MRTIVAIEGLYNNGAVYGAEYWEHLQKIFGQESHSYQIIKRRFRIGWQIVWNRRWRTWIEMGWICYSLCLRMILCTEYLHERHCCTLTSKIWIKAKYKPHKIKKKFRKMRIRLISFNCLNRIYSMKGLIGNFVISYINLCFIGSHFGDHN